VSLHFVLSSLAGFSADLKKSLAPLAGKQGVGDGDRADLNELYRYATTSKLHLFVKLFRDDAEVELAKKQLTVGARPWAMMVSVMLKKPPTTKQTTELTKAGFVAVPIR
jgi:hypothetical protein